MPVTEFAILSLRPGYDELDFLETLMQCQEIQDAWTRIHHPYNLEPNTNLSSMYIEHGDEPALLITAPWDSADAHGEWIQTGENQVCNAKLSSYIKPGCDTVLLLHLHPAGREKQLRRAFLAKESFNVVKITVNEANKDALQKGYQTVEREEMGEKEGDQKLWGGWRVEELHGKEELVLFWTDEVSEGQVQKLLDLGETNERRRFRHVV